MGREGSLVWGSGEGGACGIRREGDIALWGQPLLHSS